jgi:hypothetical protein
LRFLVALDQRRIVRRHYGIQLGDFSGVGTIPRAVNLAQDRVAEVGMMPACMKRASVVLDTISLGSPDASITAYTLNPAALNILYDLGQKPCLRFAIVGSKPRSK